MNDKVLILGADGQLGSDLVRAFGARAIGLTHQDIEITDAAQVASVIKHHEPSIVINAAAIVKTEWCESNSETCMAVNARGAEHVAKASADAGALIIQISTDYVFDGTKNGYTEHDIPHPLNAYGRSKYEGERLVQAANPRHYVIRTSWLFGRTISHKGHDFPRLMLKLAREQQEVRVVNDQFGSPTYTRDLAAAIQALVDAHAPYGIYHLTNSGVCSWYEFAQAIFALTNTHTSLIPVSTMETNPKVLRPANSVLIDTKLASLHVPSLRPWNAALQEYFKELTDA